MGADQHHRAVAARPGGTAYLAATRYKLDDFAPYLYKTSDYGETLDEDHRRHRRRRLHARRPRGPGAARACSTPAPRPACTSRSTTARAGSGCGGNLPVVPIHDLVVKAQATWSSATHGRSFWVLDDLTLLRQLGDLPAQPELSAADPARRGAARAAARLRRHAADRSQLHLRRRPDPGLRPGQDAGRRDQAHLAGRRQPTRRTAWW